MKYAIYLLLIVYVVLAASTIIFFDGTGDAGDSILHYLFAKYAPQHPHLFFDHWAKPLYVLLSSPFAQFGFVGAKVFNVVVSFFTIWLTYGVAQRLGYSRAVGAALILMCTPLYYSLTFTGLTEPLYALFLMAAIYAAVCQRFWLAYFIISFHPLVRSEGLLTWGIFGLYALYHRHWKLLPIFAAGHLIYGFAGFFVFQDLLWTIKEIPYSRLSSEYGSGELFHFVTQLYYVVGLPIYVFFGIGFLRIGYKIIVGLRQKQLVAPNESLLIWAAYGCYFAAHSLFWYLGIFNSMGLNRVLIGVAPLSALIALEGINFITACGMRWRLVAKALPMVCLASVAVFPFTPNPAAIRPQRDLGLLPEQYLAQDACKWLQERYGSQRRIVCMSPYVGELLGMDYFDDEQRLPLRDGALAKLRAGDVVVWDSWFAREFGIVEADLAALPTVQLMQRFEREIKGKMWSFVIYEVVR